MGLFNFLKKKRNRVAEVTTQQESNKSSIINNETTSTDNNSLIIKGLTIHHDLKDLVWIGDGKYKNFNPQQENNTTINLNDIQLTISILTREEPSLIYTSQTISKPLKLRDVERPPYYPTYSGLTPEQKWVYLNLLANPYNPAIDIGFVFILYYGLERHLLLGNFEKAVEVILKLRDVHTNKSFQSYSANAIILSCMIHQRGDLALKFIRSLDKEHEFAFSDNLFLICYFSFDLPLLPKDIMRLAKTFEFKNTNYIKKYPDLFLESLKEAIIEKLGVDSVNLKQYLTPSEIKKIKKYEAGVFANVSIIDETVQIPLLSENFILKKEMYNFLEVAHETVKTKLAKLRKSGAQPKAKHIPKQEKPQIVFDKNKEAELSKNKKNPWKRHFIYIDLQNFYYRYRSLGEDYINKCINYCFLSIDSISEVNRAYVNEEKLRLKQLSPFYDKQTLNTLFEEVEQKGFKANIPAFSRLAIIFEKQKKFQEAIDICDKAIEYGQQIEEFSKRKQKIQKMMGTQ